MERMILSVIFLILWKLGDPWLNDHVMLFREKTCDHLEAVLKIKLDQKWMLDRIQGLKYVRYMILLIILDIRFSYLVLFVLTFVFKSPYIRLRHKAKQHIQLVRYQFPIYLRQLQILLQNNTVVNAVELSLAYVPDVLKEDIHIFHTSLLEDSRSLNTYISQMQAYQLPEITRAFKWLYRYQSIGSQDAYRQFNRMILSTSKWLRQARIHQKQNAVGIYQWMGMLPLVGVTLVFISAMLSVALTLFERG
ncbi:MAG TPA: hypothetical protein DIC19_00650 [Erysipelotrichaceae bacterium]|nr:hypothetical protein [Erysipelotrichaceae bacterium]